MALGSKRARVEIDAGTKGLDRGLADARKKLRSFGSGVKNILGKLGGAGKALLGGIGTGLGMDVGGGLAGLVGDVFAAEKSLVRFQIAASQSPAQMAAFRGSLLEVSTASGVSRQALLDGAAAYVALTGDAAGAKDSMKLFAMVTNATGAEMGDIAATAASMKDNLKIDPKNMQQAFDILITQGKEGAVELRELATLLAGIAPSASQFAGGGGVEGLSKLGAALQVVKKGFGTSSEAATGLQGLFVALQKNAKKFEAAGVKIYTTGKNGKKTLRGLYEIIDAIGKSKLAKDPTLLSKAFGRDEAKRAYDQLIEHRDLLDQLATQSMGSDATAKDSAIYQESAAGRIAKSWEGVKNAMAEVFTPERIKKFADVLTWAVDQAAKLIGYIDRLSSNDNLAERRTAAAEDLVKSFAGKSTKEKVIEAYRLRSFGNRVGRNGVISNGVDDNGMVLPANTPESPADRAAAIEQLLAGTGVQLPSTTGSKFGNIADIARAKVEQRKLASDFTAGLADAIKAQLKTLNITVKADGTGISKAVSKAPVHHTRPGGGS